MRKTSYKTTNIKYLAESEKQVIKQQNQGEIHSLKEIQILKIWIALIKLKSDVWKGKITNNENEY